MNEFAFFVFKTVVSSQRKRMDIFCFSFFLIFIFNEAHSVRYGIASNLQPYMWVTFPPFQPNPVHFLFVFNILLLFDKWSDPLEMVFTPHLY